MDIKEKIQLGQFENVDSVNVDNSIKLSLKSNNKIIVEDNIRSTIDVTDIFDIERQNIDIYRIHGQFQYLGITNNIRDDYYEPEDFFTRPFAGDGLTRRNILTDFQFYLVKPVPPVGTFLLNSMESSGYTSTSLEDRFIQQYEVIATPDNFDIYKAGFSKNIFNEQQYSFNLTIDIDLNDTFDGFNFPLTEIYVYAVYLPQLNGNGGQEQIREKKYNLSGDTDGWEVFKNSLPILQIGDTVIGNVVTYDERNYSQSVYNEMIYQISLPYNGGNLRFNYNPFIPIQVRVMSNDLQRVSTGSTDYIKKDLIPAHATNLGGGDYVWRNLLDKGFIDPLTEEGVNYPFINQKHYIFVSEVISLESDNTHPNNITLFGQTIFGNNQLVKNVPTSDLDKLGDKC